VIPKLIYSTKNILVYIQIVQEDILENYHHSQSSVKLPSWITDTLKSPVHIWRRRKKKKKEEKKEEDEEEEDCLP
jgi:hypothetical protein